MAPPARAVGVIGIGAMGLPIAGHLARAAGEVVVHDRDPGLAAADRGAGS